VFATVPPPSQRLLVFARLPELGQVKTRLGATIGDQRALAVYEAMLRDVIASIGESTPDTEIEFLWTPATRANGEALRRAFAHHAVAMQTGKDLSERLSMAFSERFFFHCTEKIIAIGVDDPTLPRELLDHAFALLDSCEFVVGPATDGGYYLIGCRAGAFDPDVFDGIEWGTSRVFAATMEKIRAIGRTVAVLPERYDIDVVEDLERFAREGREGELGRILREGAER
jgi:rSAM/selenodomain-associated transferase 1